MGTESDRYTLSRWKLVLALSLGPTGPSVTPAFSSTPLPVLSREVEMKDLDQVRALVMQYRNQDLNMEDKEEELRVNLFDALRVLFARRDHDGTRSKILNSMRASLAEDEADVIDRVVDESIAGLKNHASPVQEQKTHFLILHNFIKEYQGRTKDFSTPLAKIRDAEIEISDRLKTENKLSTMSDNESPSKTASRVLGNKI